VIYKIACAYFCGYLLKIIRYLILIYKQFFFGILEISTYSFFRNQTTEIFPRYQIRPTVNVFKFSFQNEMLKISYWCYYEFYSFKFLTGRLKLLSGVSENVRGVRGRLENNNEKILKRPYITKFHNDRKHGKSESAQ
jgi:hypothetical protein